MITFATLIATTVVEILKIGRTLLQERDAHKARQQMIASLQATIANLDAYLDAHPDDSAVRRQVEQLRALEAALLSEEAGLTIAIFEELQDIALALMSLVPSRETRAFQQRLRDTANAIGKDHVAEQRRRGIIPSVLFALVLGASLLAQGCATFAPRAGVAYYITEEIEPGISVRSIIYEFPEEVTDPSQVRVILHPSGRVHVGAPVELIDDRPTTGTVERR